MSPSNRQRLRAAGLYDTSRQYIEEASKTLADEVFDKFLKPTRNRWLGLVEGHHFFELSDGTTTDYYLANKLGAPFLGSSALVRVQYGKGHDVVLYMHHGKGGGTTLGAPLNTLNVVAQGIVADVFLMGHTTKTPATKFARVEAVWNDKTGNHDLNHKEVILANTGGFCKSNIVGHTGGVIPRGDYAEQGMMTPSPLSAPIIYLKKDGSIRIEI